MTTRCAVAVAIALLGGLACARPSAPGDVPEKAEAPSAGRGQGAASPGSSASPSGSAASPSGSASAAPTPNRAAPPETAAPPQAKTLWRPIPPPRAEPVAALPPVPPAEVRFSDLAGFRGELDALRARGRPVLVNYWATWCGACMQEMPHLGDLGREWGDGGPAILGVSLDRLTVSDDDPVLEKVRATLARHRVSYPNRIMRGDQQEVFDAFGIASGIPVSVFYDGRGAVVRRFTGSISIDEARAVSRSLAAGRGGAVVGPDR